MSLQTDSIRAALLYAGQELELSRTVIDCTVSPTPGVEGYAVGESTVGVLIVGMRRSSPGRQVDIRVTTADLTATYTAIVGGTSVAYDAAAEAPADVEELAEGWAAAITADATVGSSGSAHQTVATAVDSTGSGTADTVRIIGQTPSSWSFAATVTGTAAATVSLDPESATIDLYERRAITTVSSRVTAQTTAPGDTYAHRQGVIAQAGAWGLMQGPTGDAQLAIADGLGRSMPIAVPGVTSVRPYITGVGYVSGDDLTSGSGVTIDKLAPVALVVYGVVAG